jgi:uncharacterized protein (DUF169 family)
MTEEEPLEPQEFPLIAEHLHDDLELHRAVVAVHYRDLPAPDSVPHGPPAPSVCSFFLGAQDQTFQASMSDHTDCEIGAYVLGVPPGGELGRRLGATVDWMVKEHYLLEGEAASIPHNPRAPPHVVYGPLGKAREIPTAVLLFVKARGAMLATEAAHQAWPTQGPPPLLTRPMCAILPVLNSGAPMAISVGCAGSRLYTQMGDDEVLVGVRGDALLPFADAVHRVRRANDRVWAHDQRTLARFQQRVPG